jgi:hypothetical protein
MDAVLLQLPVGLDAAVGTFVHTLKQAAIASGCRCTSSNPASTMRIHHKPWFDSACREALRALRRATTVHAPASSHVLACQRRLRNICQQRKQHHKKGTALEFARLLRTDPNRMWRALQHGDRSGSAAGCPADPHACTAYFSSVFNPVVVSTHQPPQPHNVDLGNPSDCSDAAFNEAISSAEVHDAFRRLKNGKSPGIDGLPAELLKYAYPPCSDAPTSHLNPLVAPLVVIFNHLLTHSVVPEQWSATLVTLLFKKGDPTLWANYRPIAVVQLLTKVYAMILHQRLSAWAESTGVREPAQTGFRPNHATTHHAFVLQHHISKCKAVGKKLYCCFIDFAKAYDCVPREKLWQRLFDIGVRGKILHAIKSLYDVGVDMSIKLDVGVLDPISTTVGVKQGCPLSPLLFGLYIEGMEAYVRSKLPQAGPSCGGVHMALLMYADDTAVLANSEAELQSLLDCIQDWCCEHGMTIHIHKTEIVVFNTTASALSQLGTRWSIAGVHVKVSQHFKYLGIHFHFSKGAAFGAHKAAQRGRFAVACLHRKLHDLDVGSNIALTLHLYSAMVQPALLYGCEVWGQHCLTLADPTTSSNVEVEKVHRSFVRYALRVRRCTAVWALYREAGMYPVQHACLQQMLTFLRRVLQLGGSEYVKLAMLECIADAAPVGGAMVDNWYSRLQNLLAHVSHGVFDDPSAIDVVAGVVDVDLCMTRWRSFYHTGVWHGLASDPRNAPSIGATLCTYHNWFASDLPENGACWSCAPCIAVPNIPYAQLIDLIKLRTSSHNLAVQRLREVHPRVPRASRICPLCNSGDVQDEHHMLFDCPHLDWARQQYGRLFGASDHGIKATCTDPLMAPLLASFVHHHCTIPYP